MQDQQTTVTGALVIPAGQALISGCFIGLTAGGLAWVFRGETPAAVGLAAGSACACFSWFAYRADWARRLESILGIAAQPDPAAVYNQTMRVEVITESGHHGDYMDLPGGQDRLIALAKGLMDGKKFTTRTWAGAGGLYSGPEFDRLRSELVARGLARWRSPHSTQQGCELTAKGRATMRGLALNDPTTPPLAGLKLEKA